MSDQTNSRKIEHICAFERDPEIDRKIGWFDRIRLTHRALPEVALDQVDTQCEFLGKRLSFPMLISSMTGGDHELVTKINRNLAIAAQRAGVAMAVGSQRVALSSPGAEESFRLRDLAPDVPLISNIGAVQLNYQVGVAEVQRLIDLLQADAVYLHLNPLQEAVQPEGDTDFSNLAEKIAYLVEALDLPVMLKEVGSGLAPQDIELGLKAGVRYFDLAGSGGTSWSRVESHRAAGDPLGIKFQDWGIPTPLALRLAQPYLDRATLIASGGVRDGIDMVKAVILGASLCGLAAPLLKPAMESADAVYAEIVRIRREFRTAMFLLGVRDLASLHMNTSLVLEEC